MTVGGVKLFAMRVATSFMLGAKEAMPSARTLEFMAGGVLLGGIAGCAGGQAELETPAQQISAAQVLSIGFDDYKTPFSLSFSQVINDDTSRLFVTFEDETAKNFPTTGNADEDKFLADLIAPQKGDLPGAVALGEPAQTEEALYVVSGNGKYYAETDLVLDNSGQKYFWDNAAQGFRSVDNPTADVISPSEITFTPVANAAVLIPAVKTTNADKTETYTVNWTSDKKNPVVVVMSQAERAAYGYVTASDADYRAVAKLPAAIALTHKGVTLTADDVRNNSKAFQDLLADERTTAQEARVLTLAFAMAHRDPFTTSVDTVTVAGKMVPADKPFDKPDTSDVTVVATGTATFDATARSKYVYLAAVSMVLNPVTTISGPSMSVADLPSFDVNGSDAVINTEATVGQEAHEANGGIK